jgi:teichuronic acid biosynthesis glycosyltransferase TuaC
VKVLTFTSLFPNAQQPHLGIFVYQRAAALARRQGKVVHVIAPVPYFPRWIASVRWRIFGTIAKEETFRGVAVLHPRYPLVPGVMVFHGLLVFLGCLLPAWRLHRKHDFDCIDSHYVYPDGFAAILLGRLLGLPVFISARGTDINVFPKFRLIRPLIRWAMHRADGIIAVSAALKHEIVKLGVRADKVQVITNGIDTARFHVVERSAARRELGLPEDAPIIVTVGNLVPAKSHEIQISAVAALAEKVPALQLYIVGDGPRRPALLNLIASLNLTKSVFLVGDCSHQSIKEWFSAANVSCLTSSREGQPNVVLESLACGTPVVATSVGGIPDVLVSEHLGILTERDPLSVAEGLQQALERNWDRDHIARYGQARTWDAVAEDVDKFFVNCLQHEVENS